MYILVVLILSNANPALDNIRFKDESSCLQALNKVMELESKDFGDKIRVKARCVKQ